MLPLVKPVQQIDHPSSTEAVQVIHLFQRSQHVIRLSGWERRDRRARVSAFYDQATWTNVWSNDLIGANAPGTYDDVAFPLVVTNLGAITERWALVFSNSTGGNIIGEHVGVLGPFVITSDVMPLNPSTGTPLWRIDFRGFNAGWAQGNAIRFNTVGAMFPVWIGRITRQGPATENSDKFEILVRGDVDA